MKKKPSQYQRLGVDAGKRSVRKIFKGAIDNDFPGAWVNIVRHPTKPNTGMTLHLDGDGSKPTLRTLVYRLTKDESVFLGAVDDAVGMNTGDAACSGLVNGPILVGDILDLNKFAVPKEAMMKAVKVRFLELRDLYRRYGIKLYFLGGETADLPHQVRTSTFNVGIYAEAKVSDLVLGNVEAGDRIWGFSSGGQAAFEDSITWPVMSNGATHSRTYLLSREYTKRYPDLAHPGKAFKGHFRIGQALWPGGPAVEKVLLSPTRQWPIFVKVLLDTLKKRRLFRELHGLSMNTGGGAFKIEHLGRGGILYEKRMPTPSRVFQVIQQQSKATWHEMFENHNCDIGLDVVGTKRLGPALEEASDLTEIRLYELGQCRARKGANQVKLVTDYGIFRS